MTRSPEERAATLDRLRPWVERARTFSGWDFSMLRTRDLGPRAPWRYEDLVRERAAGARAVLDVDTGGGERLAAVRDALPAQVVATESWHVNAPVAHRRLAPLGVSLVRAAAEVLPFAGGAFDLVTNRHGGWHPAEVARVLAPGGRFVTQQVGPHNWAELREVFGLDLPVDAERERAADLVRRGLEVTLVEHHGRIAYPSLGEFVFNLCVTPWTLPGFDVERDLDRLLHLEARCSGAEGFVVTECRTLLEAHLAPSG